MTATLRRLPLLLLLALLVPAASLATTVRMDTVLGLIDVELFDDVAPDTVANFLNYVADGDYDGSFIHRSAVLQDGVTPFVIQGGGFFYDGSDYLSIPTDPPVANEFSLSNLRGTIAMAKLPGDPDSATSQWFFNLRDNSAILDPQNGGFTVFGEVVGDGMLVVDAIAALQRWNASSIDPAFGEIPLIDFMVGGNVAEELVLLNSVTIVPEPATALLFAAGLAALGARHRARR